MRSHNGALSAGVPRTSGDRIATSAAGGFCIGGGRDCTGRHRSGIGIRFPCDGRRCSEASLITHLAATNCPFGGFSAGGFSAGGFATGAFAARTFSAGGFSGLGTDGELTATLLRMAGFATGGGGAGRASGRSKMTVLATGRAGATAGAATFTPGGAPPVRSSRRPHARDQQALPAGNAFGLLDGSGLQNEVGFLAGFEISPIHSEKDASHFTPSLPGTPNDEDAAQSTMNSSRIESTHSLLFSMQRSEFSIFFISAIIHACCVRCAEVSAY